MSISPKINKAVKDSLTERRGKFDFSWDERLSYKVSLHTEKVRPKVRKLQKLCLEWMAKHGCSQIPGVVIRSLWENTKYNPEWNPNTTNTAIYNHAIDDRVFIPV